MKPPVDLEQSPGEGYEEVSGSVSELFCDYICIVHFWLCFYRLYFYYRLDFLVRHPPLYVTFSVHLSVSPSIHCELYLRNHTLSDHNFCYTCGK